MRTPRVTLTDVARKAGVSVTTASFVMAGREDMRVAEVTADKVRQAARVLGYTSRSLSRRVSRLPTIAFITDTVATDNFAGQMIHGGISAAARRMYGVVAAETEGETPLEEALIRGLIDRGVEEFVYCAMATRTVTVPHLLATRSTVLVNCVDPTSTVQAILPDERNAGALAARALLDAGHTDGIWLVGEITNGPFAGRERKTGVVDELGNNGASLARHLSCPWWPPDARATLAAALQETPAADLPTAVIAMNDRVAMGVYQAASSVGLTIPGDLSVIAFDNSDLAWWLTPELTSVGLPYFDLGKRAVEVLLGAAAPADPVELISMPLHHRGSVAPPRP